MSQPWMIRSASAHARRDLRSGAGWRRFSVFFNLMTALIDEASAVLLLRGVLPDWEAMLGEIEAAGGRFNPRSEFHQWIDSWRLGFYPLLYERPEAIGVLIAQEALAPEDLKAWDEELAAGSASDRGRALLDLIESLGPLDNIACPDQSVPTATEMARWNEMPEAEQTRTARFLQYAMAGGLAMFFEYLSIAVHGEKLSSLVQRAVRGDDAAFGKAVQIDGRTLVVLPYFKERYARAVSVHEATFLHMVGQKQTAPAYKGRLRHKTLFMAFALLEGCGLLARFTGEQLLDFCWEVGIGARDGNRIDDVKNLQKRLTQYRHFQKNGGASTP